MNEDEFLARVRERADLRSTAESRTVTRATLRVLGSRLTDPETEALAAQLPGTVGEDLTWACGTGGESFDAETFVDCVYAREVENERVDAGDTEAHVRSVASVLDEAVSDGQLSDVRAQLSDSDGYDRLFDSVANGP